MENRSARPGKVMDFTDLETWQFARKLRLESYRFAKKLPKDETYGLASQIKRAAVSVTANIAEGFGRYSFQENVQFCRQSRASAYELRDHFTTALDAGYLSDSEYKALNEMAISAIRLLNGYIRSTKARREQVPAQRIKK
ncbi:MAG: four helix bundle protein [Candidatus Acidiferrum sp.]